MHLHILGICGTFMGGLALIARSAGHRVTGCDKGVYPPMSTQLTEQGIDLVEGYGADQLGLKPDLFVVGNVVSRGNPLMEAILDQGLPYVSGPQWLGEHILRGQHVLAVAGTHGKTTTSSMLAWILAQAGLDPNFLIGGVAPGLHVSARYRSESSLFVIEADEYDTAFFDKRSKFVHYRPRTAILNNLEYDHADIFPDLAAIETQFHHLVRTIPASGVIVRPARSEAIDRVLARGCWTPIQTFGSDGNWQADEARPQQTVCAASLTTAAPGDAFAIVHDGDVLGTVSWALTGTHNRMNALAALAAAEQAGVPTSEGIRALSSFAGVRRRMELRGTVRGVAVYDDFAHHPTAIATTLDGLRRQLGAGRILAALEPRSNTMKLGAMAARLPDALAQADRIFCYGETQGRHALGWNPAAVLAPLGNRATVYAELDKMVADLCSEARQGDTIVAMSNGSFGGIHQKILETLARTSP
ncbi:UDP-N-acetylmuramate:L-alanyl-gamma-D-glutamyl-meso-diaminopimelate ligase [Allopusillimonas soli]|uniref:UDP-N-acetylmuramate--L-alanyl-gamma-D-glutamyl-meso-2,6-diaminoheptandioate ligase n=1 Tax=Allopusillimonas soli TaxID=659016 RepID=A0A853FDM9_9BURK|nr:UDP-N-acetylmuramate:L-alanyl-gamma-D-glutamyl-meso-diaminopimelate ligase [Allopusillimonas soli]NYT36166.1 UDP-N-acetylmuramate:L-alanyl-gamma-D-glutamyl-meso-diaminopimelate ligase [Allopusillimonas soli]TEA76499.1 UDP-N-acetylmuramate:L-alanyl-gamma-D-glutamyl-meso-diaminopimelate ligase [Allopusillimonas soli]